MKPNQKSKTQRESCWHSVPSSTPPAGMEGCNVSLTQGRGQSGDCPQIMGTRWDWQRRTLWREWVLRLEVMESRVMARASWKGEISYFPRQRWRQSQRASNPLFFIIQNKWAEAHASWSYPAPPQSSTVRSRHQYTQLPLSSLAVGWRGRAPTVHAHFCLYAFTPVILLPGMLDPRALHMACPVWFSLRDIPWQSFHNSLFQNYRPF